jgi:hypothetical protein
MDPIGIAGGLNVYGFANGDPITYSDPFGLMRCPPMCGAPGEYVGRRINGAATAAREMVASVVDNTVGRLGVRGQVQAGHVAIGVEMESITDPTLSVPVSGVVSAEFGLSAGGGVSARLMSAAAGSQDVTLTAGSQRMGLDLSLAVGNGLPRPTRVGVNYAWGWTWGPPVAVSTEITDLAERENP